MGQCSSHLCPNSIARSSSFVIASESIKINQHDPKQFFLHRSDFHLLEYLSSNKKPKRITIDNNSYELSLEQTVLISDYLFQQCGWIGSYTFEEYFDSTELIYRSNTFESLIDLFNMHNEIDDFETFHYSVIEELEIPEFDYSEFFLKSTVLKPNQYSLLFEHNPLIIQIKNKKFKINGPLFGCLCLRSICYFLPNNSPKLMKVDIPPEINQSEFLELFVSIINIFKGKILNLTRFDPLVVKSVCIAFGIFHFFPFLKQSFDLLSDEPFLEMLAQILFLLPNDYISSLSIDVIEKIISHPSICFKTEGHFFQFLLNDESKHFLFKYLLPPAVDLHMIKVTINLLYPQLVNKDIFEILKQFFDSSFFISEHLINPQESKVLLSIPPTIFNEIEYFDSSIQKKAKYYSND